MIGPVVSSSQIVKQFVPDPSVLGSVFGAEPSKLSLKPLELVSVVIHTTVAGLHGAFNVWPPAVDILFTVAWTSDSLPDAAVWAGESAAASRRSRNTDIPPNTGGRSLGEKRTL